MNCPYCKEQTHASGYFELYHANDGTPTCANEKEANHRKEEAVNSHTKEERRRSMSEPSNSPPERIWIDVEPSGRHAIGSCFDSPNPEGESVEYVRLDLVKANYFSEYMDAMHKIDALQRELDPDMDANTSSPACR